MYNIEELKLRLLSELKEIAENLGVKNFKKLNKQDLIYAILDQQAITPDEKLPKKADSDTGADSPKDEKTTQEKESKPEGGGGKISFEGTFNFILLLGVVGSVLLSGFWHPNIN